VSKINYIPLKFILAPQKMEPSTWADLCRDP